MKRNDIYKIITISVPSAFTIVSNNIFHFLTNNLLLTIVCVVAAIILSFLFLKWAEESNVHNFDENSQGFFDFFQSWYTKQGILYVFCNDLEWLDNDKGKRVLDSIKRKGPKANLFLRNTNGEVIENLRRNQVNIFHIEDGIYSQFRFSLVDNDGLKNIIIRKKEIEGEKISFMETNMSKDPYLLDFAFDVLKHCKK